MASPSNDPDSSNPPNVSNASLVSEPERLTVMHLVESQIRNGPGFVSNPQLLTFLNENINFLVHIIRTALEMQLFPDAKPSKLPRSKSKKSIKKSSSSDDDSSDDSESSRPKPILKRVRIVDSKLTPDTVEMEHTSDVELPDVPRSSQAKSKPKKVKKTIDSKLTPSQDSLERELSSDDESSDVLRSKSSKSKNVDSGRKSKKSKKPKKKKKNKSCKGEFDLSTKMDFRTAKHRNCSFLRDLRNLKIKLRSKRRRSRESSTSSSSDPSTSSSTSSSSEESSWDKLETLDSLQNVPLLIKPYVVKESSISDRSSETPNEEEKKLPQRQDMTTQQVIDDYLRKKPHHTYNQLIQEPTPEQTNSQQQAVAVQILEDHYNYLKNQKNQDYNQLIQEPAHEQTTSQQQELEAKILDHYNFLKNQKEQVYNQLIPEQTQVEDEHNLELKRRKLKRRLKKEKKLKKRQKVKVEPTNFPSFNPHQSESFMQEEKNPEDYEAIKSSSHPLNPLLGRQDFDSWSQKEHFNLSESFLFECVSSENEQNSYQFEKYAMTSNKVKWSYLELDAADGDLLQHKQHERTKISVSLIRDYEKVGKMKLLRSVYKLVRRTVPELSRFETITIDPIDVDDVASQIPRWPIYDAAMIVLDKYGRPIAMNNEFEPDCSSWYDMLGCTGFDDIKQDEISLCWGNYFNFKNEPNIPKETDPSKFAEQFTYEIGLDVEKFWAAMGPNDFKCNACNLKYNRIHTYKVIEFKAIKRCDEATKIEDELRKHRFSVDGETLDAEEMNREFPLYHLISSINNAMKKELVEEDDSKKNPPYEELNPWHLVHRDNEFASLLTLFMTRAASDDGILKDKIECITNREQEVNLFLGLTTLLNKYDPEVAWYTNNDYMADFKLLGHAKVQQIEVGEMLRRYREKINPVVVYDEDFEVYGIKSKCVHLNFDYLGNNEIIVDLNIPDEHSMHFTKLQADLSMRPAGLSATYFERTKQLTIGSRDREINYDDDYNNDNEFTAF